MDNRSLFAVVFALLLSPVTAVGFAQEAVGGSAETVPETSVPATVQATAPETSVPAEQADYRFEKSDGGYVFKQTLRWDEVPYTLRYHLVIERAADDGKWEPCQELDTPETEAEVSLAAGRYRYKIEVRNLLDKPAAVTEWFEQTVLKAWQPTIDKVDPSFIFIDEGYDGIMTIEGSNLLAETVFTLNPSGKTGTLMSCEGDGTRAIIRFPVQAINIGSYEVSAVNPGGLSASGGPVIVKYQKPFDLDVSAGYLPALVLYDSTFADYYDSNFMPVGFCLRITAIPVKRSYGWFGLGLSLAGTGASTTRSNYSLSTKILFAHLNAVYQIPVIRNRLNLDLHAGMGCAGFYDMRFDYDNGISSPSLTTWSLSADVGASLHAYVRKRQYIAVTCDFVAAFMNDIGFGVLLPSIEFGWQF